MAFLSNILAVAQPTGAWISIIKAFEGAVGNYVLAIILLTVVIRLVWSIVETFSKYSSQKMNIVQAKMQPEMEKLEAKYANQPQILQQKKNELQQRYMGKTQIGSCLIMLVTMVLNLVIFFTLFGGLNSMASYKISQSYDNIKYTYANCLNVTNEYLGDTIEQAELDLFGDYENLKFVIEGEGDQKTISLVKITSDTESVLLTIPYKNDFSTEEDAPVNSGEGGVVGATEGESSESEKITISSNANIIKLIERFFNVDEKGNVTVKEENVVKTESVTNEEGQTEDVYVYLGEAFQTVAMKNVASEYEENKESFLWIDNIWIADSAMSKSILSYNSLAGQIGKKNVGEKENVVYNSFMNDLKAEKSKTNGYYIIPLLCIATSILTMYVTKLYNNHKNKKKGLPVVKQNAKWSQFILPVILGIFAMFYNSVFAIYMLTGQVVSTLILPLQLYIVDKIIDKKEKKNAEKLSQDKNYVDYSRKF